MFKSMPFAILIAASLSTGVAQAAPVEIYLTDLLDNTQRDTALILLAEKVPMRTRPTSCKATPAIARLASCWWTRSLTPIISLMVPST